MGLSRDNGSGKEILQGVFIKEVTVKDVMTIQQYKESKGWEFNDKYPKTIELAVQYNDGKYDNFLEFRGNLYKNGDIPINISNWLLALGVDGEESWLEDFEKGVFNSDFKNFVLEKKFKVLTFVKASGYYDAWNGQNDFSVRTNVFDLDTNNKEIIEAFKTKMESNYPLKYDVTGLKPKGAEEEAPLPEDMPI